MVDKPEAQGNESMPEKEIKFKCQFCEQSWPLSELVVIRQFYPQLTACKDCARDIRSKLVPK